MGNATETALYFSDFFEVTGAGALWIITTVYALFLLGSYTPNLRRGESVTYTRLMLLIMAGAFLVQSFIGMLLFVGFESVGETLGATTANMVNDVLVRDYRWVSIPLTTTLAGIALTQFNGLNQPESLGFAFTTLMWGIIGFHVQRATTLLATLMLTIFGVFFVVGGGAVLLIQSNVKVHWISWTTPIYVFFFGSMLTDWVILVLSNPVVNEGGRVLGNVAPSWIYWASKVLALAVITVVIAVRSSKRKPRSNNQKDLTQGYDVAPAAAKAFVDAGLLLPSAQLQDREAAMRTAAYLRANASPQ